MFCNYASIILPGGSYQSNGFCSARVFWPGISVSAAYQYHPGNYLGNVVKI